MDVDRARVYFTQIQHTIQSISNEDHLYGNYKKFECVLKYFKKKEKKHNGSTSSRFANKQKFDNKNK